MSLDLAAEKPGPQVAYVDTGEVGIDGRAAMSE